MSTKLLKRLSDLADNDKNLDVLISQWTFDEKLISKALSNINTVFSHYSRHDESHSRQILVNIERILQNKINLLSATDIWMLLEASYCHDIGMVIPIDHMKKDWLSQEFQEFLADSDTAGYLKEICRNINIDNPFNSSSWPIEFFENIRLVLSDFYRSRHAARSEAIVNNPWAEISLSSPRTELLPKRLFGMVGKICLVHGQSFDEVMKLPQVEVGVGNDDVHPRLIACLLRIGDLLDLDNNRFCPVMLRSAGEIPKSTKGHIDKHLSVQEFRADDEAIDIFAACETYEGYSETQKWFSYIKNEFADQMMRWHDIVPSNQFGSLPTIGRLDIKLNNFELIDGKSVPKFNINKERIFEMVVGSEIYSSSAQSIREVLQNSVDACLISAWLVSDKKEVLMLPSSEAFKLIDDLSVISVFIERVENKNGNSKRLSWRIKIEDNGVGMDKDGISCLQNIGSSRRSSKFKKIIADMPLWMRPSGSFGLGFQSVFLLTDEVEVATKYIYSNDEYKIILKDPRVSGDILLAKVTENHGIKKAGTSVSFFVSYDYVPSSYSIDLSRTNAMNALKSHDPILGIGLDIGIANILDEVEKFSEASPIKINVLLDGINKNFKNFDSFETIYYSPTNGIQLSSLLVDAGNAYQSRCFFKWQEVKHGLSEFPFIAYSANILGYDASDILHLSRNELKKSKKTELRDKIKNSIIEYIKSTEFQFLDKDKPYLDGFLLLNNIPPIFGERHLDINIGDVSIRCLLSCDSIHFKFGANWSEYDGLSVTVADGVAAIMYRSLGASHKALNVLNFQLRANGFDAVEVLAIPNHLAPVSAYEFKINKNSNSKISDDALKEILSHDFWGGINHKRNVILCEQKYESLAVSLDDVNGHFSELGYGYNYNPKIMIFPFVFEGGSAISDSSQELIEFIYKHRLDADVTRESIKTANIKYINRIRSLMKDKPVWSSIE